MTVCVEKTASKTAPASHSHSLFSVTAAILRPVGENSVFIMRDKVGRNRDENTEVTSGGVWKTVPQKLTQPLLSFTTFV